MVSFEEGNVASMKSIGTTTTTARIADDIIYHLPIEDDWRFTRLNGAVIIGLGILATLILAVGVVVVVVSDAMMSEDHFLFAVLAEVGCWRYKILRATSSQPSQQNPMKVLLPLAACLKHLVYVRLLNLLRMLHLHLDLLQSIRTPNTTSRTTTNPC